MNKIVIIFLSFFAVNQTMQNTHYLINENFPCDCSTEQGFTIFWEALKKEALNRESTNIPSLLHNLEKIAQEKAARTLSYMSRETNRMHECIKKGRDQYAKEFPKPKSKLELFFEKI